MSFESFQDFLHMGGHGPYVWWSYVAGALVLGINLVRLVRERRKAWRTAERLAVDGDS